MRNKKAKYIKNKVYGDFSPRFRTYHKDEEGTVFADSKRRKYKHLKRLLKGKVFLNDRNTESAKRD
jgi:hypothetical protein